MVHISIITVCFNAEETIERTIQSVISQESTSYEYIIIDGKSTDSTISIIQKYQNKISKFISEPDLGIYDAMNKGLFHSSGDVIFFLNSGDFLASENIIEEISSIFNTHEEYKLIYGNYIKFSGNYQKKVMNCENRNILEFIRKSVCHQTIFARKEILLACNGFDLNYRMYADLDFVLKCLIDFNIRMYYVDKTICYSLLGGVCMKYCKTFASERLRLIMVYLKKIDLKKNITRAPISFILLCLFILSRWSYTFRIKNVGVQSWNL